MTHSYVRSRIALVALVFLTRSQTEKRVCSLDRPDMSARYPTLADLYVRSRIALVAPVFLTRSHTEKRVCSLDRPDMSARYPTLADGVAREVLL
jgi:predicted deacylase